MSLPASHEMASGAEAKLRAALTRPRTLRENPTLLPSGSKMKYLTTLEVAHELGVSKQTLLNWLYAGKLPEPPRNKKDYRL